MNELKKEQIEFLDSLDWKSLFQKGEEFESLTDVWNNKRNEKLIGNMCKMVHTNFPDLGTDIIAVYLSNHQQKHYESFRIEQPILPNYQKQVEIEKNKIINEIEYLDKSNLILYYQQVNEIRLKRNNWAYKQEESLSNIILTSDREDLLDIVAFGFPIAIKKKVEDDQDLNRIIIAWRGILDQAFNFAKIKYNANKPIMELLDQLEKKYNKCNK